MAQIAPETNKKRTYMSLWQNMCFRRLLLLNEELSKKRGAVIKCARLLSRAIIKVQNIGVQYASQVVT